jgi:16S rRNA (uracil1498-N3)-methyltransferase
MPRIFLPDADLNAGSLLITGIDFHHLVHVLRVKPGAEIVVLDNRRAARRGTIRAIGKVSLDVDLAAIVELPPEPSIKVTVAQALGKGDKCEQVIQHGTEIGAHAFIPLLTSRTVVKLDRKNEAHWPERLARVAKGAAEQSGRGRIPDVLPCEALPDLCKRFLQFDAVYMLDGSGAPLGKKSPLQNILILVGPEGGFTPGELTLARESGAIPCSLGPYTMRTETAALVALSRLLA